MVSAAYIHKWWENFDRPENLTENPQPFLQELIKAVRRGVEVKVLLNCGRLVVISSMNGSENSFRYARELALRIEGASTFMDHFRELCQFDWQASDKPNRPANLLVVPRPTGTFIGGVRLNYAQGSR